MLASLAFVVAAASSPNLVLLFMDDLGIGDLSCYGNKRYKTPNIDRLAAEGIRFTDFYVPSPACTPSRAALLTGCYPPRISLTSVLGPNDKYGLHPNEVTIAEIAKSRGYKTAIFGKWHLGVKNLMPRAHGFDEFFGIPYSSDMWPKNGNWPPLFAYENETPAFEITRLDQQSELTQTITSKTIEFIQRNKANRFLVYVPLHMPHVPIAASSEFLGRTGKGLYADMMTEVDHCIGRIIESLRKNGLSEKTLVFFGSDNGPWLPYGNHAGSSGIYREGKGASFEGGIRVPGIFWMPGTISPGIVQKEMASTMDILPTFAKLVGSSTADPTIDGHDIWPLLSKPGSARTPWRWMFYFWPGELQAVRSGDWKLHVPHSHRHQAGEPGIDGLPAGEVTAKIGLSLFNLADDPGERRNLAEERPEVVERLMRIVNIGRREFGDTLTKTKGSEVRAPGKVE